MMFVYHLFLLLISLSVEEAFIAPWQQRQTTSWFPSFGRQTTTSIHQLSSDASLTFPDLIPPPASLPPWLLRRCNELGYTCPTIVQEAALPAVFNGEDVVLQAQTGSGKTLVYCLPVLSKIDPKRAAIQAVIVVPSRELGLQVAGVLKQLASGSPEKIMVMSLVEGSNNRRQQLWAVSEPPHIVVGNPKSLQRIVDLGRLRLNAVSFVVVDEVDACLISPETRLELHTLLSRRLSPTYGTSEDESANGMNDMKEDLVYTNLAKDRRDMMAASNRYRNSRQTILCSATIPQRQHFAAMCEKEGWTETLPRLIHVTPEELVPKQVRHEYVDVPVEQRLACLKYLLVKEMQSWGSDEEEKASGSSEASNRSESRDNSVSDGDDGSVSKGSASSSSSSIKRGLLRRVRVNKSSSSSSVDTTEGPTSIPSDAISASISHTNVPSDNSNSNINGRSSEQGGRGGSIFQAVIFVDNGAYANVVYETASAALQSYQRLQPSMNEGEEQGIVTYLSDTGSLDERAAALNAFREGKAHILVCSDIAARGLDVPNVSHVFQLRLPDNVDEYIHKSGRAGRMGRRGKAITFIATEEKFVVQRFSNEVGVPIHRRPIKNVKKST